MSDTPAAPIQSFATAAASRVPGNTGIDPVVIVAVIAAIVEAAIKAYEACHPATPPSEVLAEHPAYFADHRTVILLKARRELRNRGVAVWAAPHIRDAILAQVGATPTADLDLLVTGG